MTILDLKKDIGDGNDRQSTVLFTGPRRKIIQITLRNNGVLAVHQAAEPITIQCVAGAGTLSVGQEKQRVALTPGSLVTIEADTVHEIHAEPAVSILLSKFTEK